MLLELELPRGGCAPAGIVLRRIPARKRTSHRFPGGVDYILRERCLLTSRAEKVARSPTNI